MYDFIAADHPSRALRPRVIIAYRILDDRIEVTRVFYGGQDYEAILRNEPD